MTVRDDAAEGTACGVASVLWYDGEELRELDGSNPRNHALVSRR